MPHNNITPPQFGGLINLGPAITREVLSLVDAILRGVIPPAPIPPRPVPPRPVPPRPTPVNPTTLRGLLLSLVNRQVQITTSYDTLTGTLIGVYTDYAALVESTGALTLVRLEEIYSVVEL